MDISVKEIWGEIDSSHESLKAVAENDAEISIKELSTNISILIETI